MAPTLSMKPVQLALTAEMLSLESTGGGPSVTTLSRSESASSSLSNLHYLSPLALTKDRKLDSNCRCKKPKDKCDCEETCLHAEKRFVSWLTTIGDRLKEEPGKGEKTRRLVSELMLLNMQLPARVWVPFLDDHIVLRIPPTNGCVLNSKDKAPYCIYVEILRCKDLMTVEVPKSKSESETALQYRLGKEPSFEMPRELSTLSEPEISVGNETELNKEREAEDKDEDQITIVECKDEVVIAPDKMLEGVPAPEPAWDTMSLESSASEPALRTGNHITSDLSRRLKEWVKRPGRRRQMRPHPDDPSASTLSEPWEEKRDRIRHVSPYGSLDGWDLLPLIVKSGDDLAQELLAYQLLATFKHIWAEEDVPLYLRPYKILVTSSNSGMIEPIIDACSLHQIKRNQYAIYKEEGRTTVPSLLAYYIETFGSIGTPSFLKAQQNFVQSCAAYSLISYFLQVKDRHNGNILIDADGHLIHIDFGFILSVSPRNLGFETSPFKLTSELIDVMGGLDYDMFAYFKSLLLRGLIAARKHHEEIMTIVEIMSIGSHLPCFRAAAPAIRALRDRFHVTSTDQQLQQLVSSMVESSRDSLTTRLYDNYQYYTNGIL
ncbi:hypothetical protein WR25_02027 [Diploscapter pachys]|uniref:1-phosphatidylinositol 4-kinase n=1 Tax=Diploscapter pachys TaxID=2018661 RepID=A0A2A2K9H7_9BILA|nr:hypothetical protein WR25_02027 [Diploscapter pachys]